jgi:hypothetical protein
LWRYPKGCFAKGLDRLPFGDLLPPERDNTEFFWRKIAVMGKLRDIIKPDWKSIVQNLFLENSLHIILKLSYSLHFSHNLEFPLLLIA